MRRTFALLALATALAGCSHTYPNPNPALRGVEPVNVPVVTRSDFVFDTAAPDGSLGPSEEARLDAWFRSLQLGYGDSIYVDGYAGRDDVAKVAGRYGLMVSDGAPVTVGPVAPGSVRVVVSRFRAGVPNCPNWSVPSQPNLTNASMAGLGCAVNTNLAAMVANPEDLLHGREGGAVVDPRTASRAVGIYRSTAPTGTQGLQSINTKGN